ncbi:MAG: DUF4129 domain-containing protein [Planctomycetales bacterium]|nr:DUF4129 domain-containing protein [Planctomycetales bacterium]
MLRLLLKPFEWFFDALGGLPTGLKWIVFLAAVLLCVLLIAHIGVSFSRALRANATISPRRRKERNLFSEIQGLEQAAAAAEARGDCSSAVHLLMRAAACHLELARGKSFRPGVTNRDLLRLFDATVLFAPLRSLVDAVDLHWYGDQPCPAGVFSSCRSAYFQVRDHAAEIIKPPVSA